MQATNEEENQKILEIHNLNKSFGGLQAVSNFSLSLQRGELKGLIGPNGAGKTTVFNLITGFHKPDSGVVTLAGEEITPYSPDQIVNRGLARTFQEIRMMSQTTVINDICTACFRHMDYNIFDLLLRTPRYWNQEQRTKRKVYELLELLEIEHLDTTLGTDLSYGQQRRVSIARALILQPEVLLLDEPTAGLNPSETDELVNLILDIKGQLDLTIIIVEHDMRVIMDICDNIVAMNEGTVIGAGPPQEIQENDEVIEAYLGRGVK